MKNSSETYNLASTMNAEKQYSEYKIIDTTITPVYEGAPVETHPEDQLEGGDTPVQETQWIAIKTGVGQVTCEPGYIQNNIIHIFGKSTEEKILIVLVENGLVVAEGEWSQTIEKFIYRSVRAVYENVSDNIVIDDSTYNINDNIENWNTFEIIEPV